METLSPRLKEGSASVNGMTAIHEPARNRVFSELIDKPFVRHDWQVKIGA